MAINSARVVTGGLLAGLVMNILDAIWNYTVLNADMAAMVQQFHLDPAVTTDLSYALPWIAIDFVLGLVVVWTYAAMRPRLGQGPKTAVLASLVPWVSVTSVLCGFAAMGVFSATLVTKGSVCALITTVGGGLAGAWAYTE